MKSITKNKVLIKLKTQERLEELEKKERRKGQKHKDCDIDSNNPEDLKDHRDKEQAQDEAGTDDAYTLTWQ